MKTSFCDVTITKAKKIILTIDLSKKDSVKKKSITKVPQLSPPKTLYEIMQNHIDNLTFKSIQESDANKSIEPTKATRKLAKKLIKCKKLRLSEVASELGISKNNLKMWLMKGEKEEEDGRDYDELLQSWVMSSRKDMSIEDTYDVINRYNKSFTKSLLKARPKLDHDPDSIQMEAVILDSSFPRKRVHYDKKTSIEDKGSRNEQALNLIQINVTEDNVNLRDTVMWDSTDTGPDLTSQFANGMLRDYLEERKIELPLEKINNIIGKIQDQISKQVETSNDLQAQTQALVTFNGNINTFKQKECIIKVTLDIKEEGFQIKDMFDWELDPSLNKPEAFAEQYVNDNNLPIKFVTLISAQIRMQVSSYLHRRLNNFLRLYEPKMNTDESAETPEGKKKLNIKIKENILHSLNENLESFPTISAPYKSGQFLKNQELYSIVKKYSDYLAPPKKKIFQRQKVLFEQNYKKIPKVVQPKKQASTPPTSDQGSVTHGKKPHNLRPRSFNKNYRVLAGDLINAPVVPDSATDGMNTSTKGTIIAGSQLPDRGGQMSQSTPNLNMKKGLTKRTLGQKGHLFSQGRMVPSIYRTNAKHYGTK